MHFYELILEFIAKKRNKIHFNGLGMLSTGKIMWRKVNISLYTEECNQNDVFLFPFLLSVVLCSLQFHFHILSIYVPKSQKCLRWQSKKKSKTFKAKKSLYVLEAKKTQDVIQCRFSGFEINYTIPSKSCASDIA